MVSNRLSWIFSEEGWGDQIPANQTPSSTPGSFGDPMAQNMNLPMSGDPSPNQNPSSQTPKAQTQDPNDDISADPDTPDMPERRSQFQDFEVWRNHYLRESIKGNPGVLIDLIHHVRNHDLDPSQRKFVEDNLQIQFLRQQANIIQASKEIRKNISEELDKNNPSTSIVNHLFETLTKQRMLADVFIKLNGYYGMKGDLHRKYLASLFGAVQIGLNGVDLIALNENTFSVMITTRMNADFGDITIGEWSLLVHDPERFLSEPEQRKLMHGSPEEREVLRHRVIIESIATQFKERAFILSVVSNDGTIYNIGLDMATCLRSSYLAGKLVVRTHFSQDSEVMLDEDGNVIPFVDLDIKYVRDTGDVDNDGRPRTKELNFFSRRKGMISLVADVEVIKNASSELQGLAVTGIPYQGNPSDLRVLSRCVWNASDMLMRQC